MKTQTHLTTLPASAPSVNGSPLQDNLNADPAVAGFLAARDRLQQREQELETELAGVRQLLNGGQDVPVRQIVPPPLIPGKPQVPPSESTHRPNAGLRQAVIELILQHGPLSKDQIVALLTAKKFPFFGKPKPALDPVLYSKKFRRDGKIFSLAENP